MTADQQPRTAAQGRWCNRYLSNTTANDETNWMRTEELSAEIAALRDTVAALQEQVSNNYGNADSRIRNIYSSHITPMRDRLTALESPASAPEPVCQCGHPKMQHFAMSGSCFAVLHEFKTELASGHVTCGCLKYVPAEPPVAVPDAAPTLDPVVSAACAESVKRLSGYGGCIGIIDAENIVEMIRFTFSEFGAIRAYGRDGAR